MFLWLDHIDPYECIMSIGFIQLKSSSRLGDEAIHSGRHVLPVASHGGFHDHVGTPISAWFIVENTIKIWLVVGPPL